MDATHVEADAALKSLRAELRTDRRRRRRRGHDRFGEARAAVALAAPRSGPTPKRKASNATAVSRTDPDAKLRYKPGHRPHLVHRAQVAIDPKDRVIVAVHAEPATGNEADSLPVIIDRAQWLRHRVREIVADAGYASDAVYTDLAARQIDGVHPAAAQNAGVPGRAARTRCKTPAGVGAAIDRITHGEGAIAELKRHGVARARCRGTGKLQIQLLLAATAINLKRLTSRPPAAENAGADAAAASAHLAILNACLHTLARENKRLLRQAPRRTTDPHATSARSLRTEPLVAAPAPGIRSAADADRDHHGVGHVHAPPPRSRCGP